MIEQRKARRGFAAMSPEKQREIASRGGIAAHQAGTAHQFTPEEAKAAGNLGGKTMSSNREHMAEIGRKGRLSPKKSRRFMKTVALILSIALTSCAAQTPKAGPITLTAGNSYWLKVKNKDQRCLPIIEVTILEPMNAAGQWKLNVAGMEGDKFLADSQICERQAH